MNLIVMGLGGFVGEGGLRFGKSLVVCGPHPGGVCKSVKEKGLEATELGSVYGKWKARRVDVLDGKTGARGIEMEIRGSHG
jgi:hypothetical protein